MIRVNNTDIEFVYMGYFTTNDEWIHPAITETTYEIIYVTKGEVFLSEEDKEYELKKGDLIVLKPGTIHAGFKESHGKTEFYWTHFNMSGDIRESLMLDNFTYASLFKELLHYSSMPLDKSYTKDCILAHILAEISETNAKSSTPQLASNILEWTRINAHSGITVEKIAENFGYNSEHISRVVKKEYGMSLKQIINDFVIRKAQGYLCNTTYSIKEISVILGFSTPNAFINFYKYHEKQSPSLFRNSYTGTHMNNR